MSEKESIPQVVPGAAGGPGTFEPQCRLEVMISS